MFKRYYGFLLVVILIFLIIPTSFALDDNLTVNEQSISDDSVFKTDDMLNDIHVDCINGDDANDGSSQHPVSTIKKALNLSLNSSKIIIHEGIYRENNLNITKSLEILSNGNVVIDAENSSRIFTINTNANDSVVLSGITFINGNAYQGGAIYIRNAQTTIENSKFFNNTALAEGGAIYWNALNGKLTDCVVKDNYARDGAGVSWGGSDSEDIFAVKSDYGKITNCTFENNHLMMDEDACIGLSIYSDYCEVLNSRFINHKTDLNTSFEVLYFNGDYGVVSGCLFENNFLTMVGALGFDGNFAKAYNNVFLNNTMSSDDSYGGAIGIQSENADIYNNTFACNGGLRGVGGAIFINTVETFSFNFINITDNIFINNFAYNGGGIYTTGKSNMLTLNIKNNSFNGEKASNGAAIYLADIYNPVVIEDNNYTDVESSESSNIYASHCILQLSNNGVKDCFWKTGFIYTDGEIRSDVYLKFNDAVGALAKPVTLSADLSDDMGNSISTKAISFTANGQKLTGKTGLNSIVATFSELGTYNISGTFTCPNLKVENGTLTVIKSANLYLSNMTNYGGNVEINVALTDSNNTPLSQKRIILNVNGADYILKTDNGGKAQISLDLDYGTYNVTATLSDDDYYEVESQSVINVVSSIDASDMTRSYNSEYDFIATLFDKAGNPLNNTRIIVKVNDEEYSLISDENGMVKLVKLAVGFYIININNPVSAESINRNLNIVKRITDNSNVNMYYGAGKSYTVRVYADDGSVAGAGENVSFTVNGKTYVRKTDANGFASFRITLNAKTYTITAAYKGVKVSNKIVVKPVLTAKNISKKKSKTIKFTAKLINTNGKALKGKIIKFLFKGKTYKEKTNKNGIATLSLKNLKVGKYVIKTTYGKSSVKNTVKVRK